MIKGVYDISLNLEPSVIVYPGDPVFSLATLAAKSAGDVFNLSSISMCAHTGTHIDAPFHFFEGGKKISDYPPDYFCGAASVVAISNAPKIGAKELAGKEIPSGGIVLFKTGNIRTHCRTYF
ncbi:MAG: cyclase family protein, partial [Firmicutes bacterium]|nr:cyclase family protein [Bacillota bacterium]